MINSAFALINEKEYSKASELLKQMIKIDPKNSDAHHYLGVSYIYLKRLEEAISEIQYSVLLSPNLTLYQKNLGLAYCTLGIKYIPEDKKKALIYLQRGLSKNEELYEIHLKMLSLLFDMGLYDELWYECNKIIDKNQMFPVVLYYVILLEYCTCKPNLTLLFLKKILKKRNVSLEKCLYQLPENNGAEFFIKGMLHIYLKNIEKGVDYLKKSEQIVPGAGWTFTLKNINIIKKHYAQLLNINKSKNKDIKKHFKGIVSMSHLGTDGRLGHQFNHYLGLKMYAQRNNYQVETPDWLGRYIFEGCYHDPYIIGNYETIEANDPVFLSSLQNKELPPSIAFNLKGGCFNPSTITKDEKKYIQKILRPLPYWREQVKNFLNILKYKDSNRTIVSLHIRRGDFIKDGRYVPSSKVYLDWLENFWNTLENPILYIASDDINNVVKDFISYNPYSYKNFKLIDDNLDFIVDFFVLAQSNIMVKAGSSFSNLAALCNEECSCFYYVNPKNDTIEPC